jgi:hypothetical protein
VFAVSECEYRPATLLCLIVLIEEADQENGVQEIREHKIPKRVIVTDHSHPEEEADCA